VDEVRKWHKRSDGWWVTVDLQPLTDGFILLSHSDLGWRTSRLVVPLGGKDGFWEIYRAGKLNVNKRAHLSFPQILSNAVLDAGRRGVDETTFRWDRGGDTGKLAVQLEGGLVVDHIARQPTMDATLLD